MLDKSDKELATITLAPSRDGNTLEARIPPQLATVPLRAKATIKYDPKAREQPFDFVFTELSKDPGPARPAPATTTGAATAPARPAASGAKPAPSAAASTDTRAAGCSVDSDDDAQTRSATRSGFTGTADSGHAASGASCAR